MHRRRNKRKTRRDRVHLILNKHTSHTNCTELFHVQLETAMDFFFYNGFNNQSMRLFICYISIWHKGEPVKKRKKKEVVHSDLNIYQKCPANPQPHLLPLPVSSPTLVFLRGASQLRSCSEKSILGGGLKDLSQEYYSTARHSDKPPVTSSRDRAGQAQAPHMERGEHSALAVGRSTIMGKTWLTSLLV